MNQLQLKAAIPQMLKGSAGQESYQQAWLPEDLAWNSHKPSPKDHQSAQVPWTDTLCSIVKNCSKYGAQEQLLSSQTGGTKSVPSPIKVVNLVDGSVSFIANNLGALDNRHKTQIVHNLSQYEAKVPVEPSSMPVPISGPIPTRLFKPDSRHPHTQTSPNHGVAAVMLTSTGTENDRDKGYKEIFICYHCEKEFPGRSSLQKHQQQCLQKPPQLQVVCTPPRVTRNRPPPQISPKHLVLDLYKRPDKSRYIEALGLLPKSKADALLKQKRGAVVDCEVIDLEVEYTPQTPTTPRTPKSLISQLSRDTSPPPVAQRKSQELFPDTASDAGSESSSTSGQEREIQPGRRASLLAIDLASPLGNRVKKYINVSKSACPVVLPDYEQYCRTPVKNRFLDKLRHRTDRWPISFKKIKKPKFMHEYKFNKGQKLEFMIKMKTGLNKKSRKLKKQMKQCSVVLYRLTKEEMKKHVRVPRVAMINLAPLSRQEILRWVTPVKSQNPQTPTFPDRPTLLANYTELQRLLGLKVKSDLGQKPSPQSQLSLSQVVSEDINAEATQQKAVVYRSLLSELGKGTNRATVPATPNKPLSHHSLSEPVSLVQLLQTAKSSALGGKGQGPVSSPGVIQQTGSVTFTRSRSRPGESDQLPATANLNRMVPRPTQHGSASKLHMTRSTSRGRSDTQEVSIDLTQTEDSQENADKRYMRYLRRQSSTMSNHGANTQVSHEDVASRKRDPSAQSDDVISISSCDSTDSAPRRSKRLHKDSGPSAGGPPAKRRKEDPAVTSPPVSGGKGTNTLTPAPRLQNSKPPSTPVLFKCHKCRAEIICKDNAKEVIERHFVDVHKIASVRMVEWKNEKNQNVTTILEGPFLPRKTVTPQKVVPRMNSIEPRHVPVVQSPQRQPPVLQQPGTRIATTPGQSLPGHMVNGVGGPHLHNVTMNNPGGRHMSMTANEATQTSRPLTRKFSGSPQKELAPKPVTNSAPKTDQFVLQLSNGDIASRLRRSSRLKMPEGSNAAAKGTEPRNARVPPKTDASDDVMVIDEVIILD